jgi:hypothetical protein
MIQSPDDSLAQFSQSSIGNRQSAVPCNLLPVTSFCHPEPVRSAQGELRKGFRRFLCTIRGWRIYACGGARTRRYLRCVQLREISRSEVAI